MIYNPHYAGGLLQLSNFGSVQSLGTGIGVGKTYKDMFDAFGVTMKTIKNVGDLPIKMT